MRGPVEAHTKPGKGAKCRAGQRQDVKEFERKQLLGRVNREGATAGTQIPDCIEVQGEKIDLRQFVFEIKRRDTIPSGEKERVDRVKRNLRCERLEWLQRIEDNEVSYDEGRRLTGDIVGIDRALNALEQLRPVGLEQEEHCQNAADQKRWMNFLKKVLGRDGGKGKWGGR